MALTDKDILITPNIGSASEPKIEFKGASASVGPSTITATIYSTNNGTLSFDGTEGNLFSIVNNLSTGSIFSVNPISGIPIIDVDANRTISLNPYGGSTGIGTTNPSQKLHVQGNVRITGGIYDSNNSVGTSGQVLKSTGTGITWVSGSGSGIDADTLDGLDSGSFLRSDANDDASGLYTFSNTTTGVKLDMSGHAGASNYNYFLRAQNDTGIKAVHFVNGSTRSTDGGANTYTIRNDGGTLRLGDPSYNTLIEGSAIGINQSSPAYTLDVNGTIRAERYRGINSLTLASYQTINPASNVFLYSQPNDRDAWIFLDSADTGSNWGIYHRQIDSTVTNLPANSIGFIGGGASALQSYISLANGNGYFAGNLGVGAVNPTDKLQVQSAAGDSTTVSIINSSSGQAKLWLQAGGSTNRAARIDFLNTQASSTVPRWTLINDYDQNGTNSFGFVNAANTRVLNILQSGNVGVGTTDPGIKLDIYGNSNTDIAQIGAIRVSNGSANPTLATLDNTSTTNYSTFNFTNIFSGDLHLRSYWGVSIDLNDGGFGDSASATQTRITSSSSFTVNRRSSSTAFSNLFTVRNSGSVGIGFTNPSYTLDVNGNSRIGRDLYISGNIAGNYGNRLVVGTTDTSYTLQDTNLRPTIQANGAYPVVSLNHTVTSNTSHGPTLQFTCNGVGNQFVIGSNGSGTFLSMGYSNAGDWNPHNGIAGYNGTSFFHAGIDGYIGLGAVGDWGPNGSGNPAYHLHFKGENNATNGHAALFDNQVNAANNGSGFLFRHLYGNHSWGIVSEYRVESNGGTDRPSILFSTGYNTDTWSVGFGGYQDSNFRINYDHGHRNSGWGTTALQITRTSDVTAFGSLRAPIFYDSDDTSYYVNPNSISRIRGLVIAGDSSSQSTLDQLGFWAVVNGVPNTTSAIGFKQVGGIWAEHGRTGLGYNTYFTMDTPGRGWIFRKGTVGGSDYTGTNVFSISNNDGETTIGSSWGTSNTFAALNVSQGQGSANTTYRDIDLRGSWASGEGHAITATHATTANNIVAQMVFEYNGPGSRIKWGRFYHSADQSTYPLQLISDGAGAYLHLSQGATPTSVGALPGNTRIICDAHSGNNYFTFRNTSDNNTQSGLIFQDNNIGGYVIFNNYSAGSLGDSMIYGAYQDHIFQTGTSDTITGKTEVLRIKQNGNVGIGTTDPNTKLHIFSSETAANLLRINNGTQSLYLGVNNGAGGSYVFEGGNNALRLGTNDTERLRISSGGNIGIGTTDPLQKLDVRGNFLLAVDGTTATHITQKPYTINGGTLSWEGSAGQLFSITNNLTSGSIFSVNDVSGIPSIDVDANGTIQLGAYGGNIGVGVTNPTQKLDVNGALRLRGALYDVNNSAGTSGQVLKSTGIGVTWVSGSGSGIDADLLDGLNSTQFLRSDTTNTASGGVFIFRSADGVDVTNTGQINGLQVYQNNASTDALMSFHVSADFACHFGLSGGLNDLVVGGWSFGGVEYRILHTGNTTRTNYKDLTDSVVSGQLMWKNYGNNHTIFDASAGTSPSGTSVNRFTPDYPVEGSGTAQNTWGYNPVLMGWNGSNTYGVKVDFARNADLLDGLNSATTNTASTIVARDASGGFSAGIITATTGSFSNNISAGLNVAIDPSNVGGGFAAGQITESTTGFSAPGMCFGTGTGQHGAIVYGSNTMYFGSENGSDNTMTTRMTLSSAGNLAATGTVTANSDIKLKKNIKTIENALDKVLNLRGVEFDRIDIEAHQIGVIAQEVEKVIPEVVLDNAGTKSVAYGNLVSVLIEAVKEQQSQIEELKSMINSLLNTNN